MTQTKTAMYDTRGAAETARDGLISLGIAETDVSIRGTDDAGASSVTSGSEDKGFWASLADMFVPNDDRPTYEEGMRRGGYLLSARVPDELATQAEDVMEQADPIDIDARSESWRQEGWSNQGTTSTGGTYAAAGLSGTGMTDYGADTGTRATGGTAYGTSGTAASALADDTGTSSTMGSGIMDSGRTGGMDTDSTGMMGAGTGETMGTGTSAYTGTDRTAGTTATDTTAYAGTGGTASGLTGTTAGLNTGDTDETLQVVEEDLRVGKREVAGGRVRVRTYVTERPVEEDVNLRSERVTIERRPVDREVAPGAAAFQERTIEAVERGEEAVVSKTAHVKEEIAIHKDVETHTETVHDTVRSTEVEVDDDRTGLAGTDPALRRDRDLI